jgi:hypothetical protein
MASAFANVGSLLQSYGVTDILLPFLLVFTIIFAVMQRTHILGHKKNFNVVIALVLGLLFVMPHLTGSLPLGYDPVNVLNEVLPSISLVAVAAIMLLVLLGIFGKKFSKTMAPLIAILAIGFVAYIFGASLNLWTGPYDVFWWWNSDTTLTVVILLVFGVIVWLVTKEPSSWTDTAKDVGKGLTGLFEEAGKRKE